MNTQPFSQTDQMIELCSEYLSVRCIWLYVLGMFKELHARSSRDILRFKWLQLDLNPEPLGSKMNTQPFGQAGLIIELCSEYLSVRCIWLYLFVMSLTRFQSESTLYSCMNVKEILAWSRRKIWNLSDCNWNRT